MGFGAVRRRDAGIAQSAMVGLLVASTLAITTGLTAYGPRVGSAVADFYVCQFGSESPAACVGGPEAVPVRPVPTVPDEVVPGVPTVIDLKPGYCADAGAALQKQLPGGRWDSTRLGGRPGAPAVSGTWVLTGCQLTVDTEGSTVHRRLSWWTVFWKAVVTGFVAIAVGGGVTAACGALVAVQPELAPLAPWCASIGSAALSFTGSLVSTALAGGPIDAEALTKAFIAALTGAVLGRLDLAQRLGTAMPGLINTMIQEVSTYFAALPARVQAWAGPAFQAVRTFFVNLAAYIAEHGLVGEAPLPVPQPGPIFIPHPI